ncbi:hypothetical protein [Pseudonocardia humida]|uniref:Alpha/beta hydrolase family protein n=1 Tax=Pseudonocardia humida TaxID=2800819 RepID=A0ABT1A0H2_9PSEU|nr:hypothetical protein [Pseudonocardia humida]MCO1656503.1 hypothetical protein [Pseudonocardia humida]
MSAIEVRRRVRRRVGVAVLLVVALLLGYLVVVGFLRSRPLALPTPSGPHPVGRVITTVDAAGTTTAEARRAAWIWYPADPRTAGTAAPAEYVPEGWSGPGSLPPTIGLGWLLQDVDAVRPSARRDAVPAPGPHPVVVLAPGYENAPWMYSALGEELASRGHVVAVLVPPSTPARVVDGQPRTTPTASAPPAPDEIDALLQQEATDIVALHAALTTAPLVAGLDVQEDRTVFIGHSLGGGAAVLACELTPRCVGSTNLDGPQPALPTGAPTKPELLLAADAGCAAVTPCAGEGQPAEYLDWLSRRRAATPPSTIATITGAGHNAFGDPAHYFVAWPVQGLSGTGPIPPMRMHTVLTTVLGTTIDRLLRDGQLDGVLVEDARELPELDVIPAG